MKSDRKFIMYKNFIVLFFLSILSLTIFAEPAPFGLELGKATYKEVKKKYPNIRTSTKFYYMGLDKLELKDYHIDNPKINIDGLKYLSLTFLKNDTLVQISADFENYRYNSLLEYLQTKYRFVSESNRVLSGTTTSFRRDNTFINISSGYKNSSCIIVYTHKSLLDLEKKYIQSYTKAERDNL